MDWLNDRLRPLMRKPAFFVALALIVSAGGFLLRRYAPAVDSVLTVVVVIAVAAGLLWWTKGTRAERLRREHAEKQQDFMAPTDTGNTRIVAAEPRPEDTFTS